MRWSLHHLATIAIGLLGLAAMVAGCDRAPAASSAVPADEPLHVVATVYALGDLVRQIGGRYVEVEWIIESPAVLAGYQPSNDWRDRIRRADLVVAGGATEPWAVLESANAFSPLRVFRVDAIDAVMRRASASGGSSGGVGLNAMAGDAADASAGLLWLDPAIAQESCTALADRLTIMRPSHDVYFHEQAKRIAGEIAEISEKFRDQIGNYPRRRALSITHDFDALAAHFSVDLEHPVTSPADRLSDANVERIRNVVRAEHLSVLLVGADTPDALMTDVAQRSSTKLFALDAYGASSVDSHRATIQDLFRYNAARLLDAIRAAQ